MNELKQLNTKSHGYVLFKLNLPEQTESPIRDAWKEYVSTDMLLHHVYARDLLRQQ